ncbi:MAG: branched-chain amino acid ABC transporter permease [Promethearchaeota archaeon]
MSRKFKKKVKGFPAYLRDWIHTFRGGLTIVCLIILSIIPLLTQNSYHLGIFMTFMIFTIYASSWDFLAGIVGQVSFGHAIFLGTAGYTTAYLVRYLSFPWWVALILGAIVAVLFGLIIGIPCLRLKGPYLALGTLAMSLIMYQLFMMGTLAKEWEKTFGTQLFGAEGISQIPPLDPNSVVEYFIIFLIMCLAVFFLTHIAKSNLGTILKAIRDDETGTSASGINTTKYKIISFVISGFFAGISGALFAFFFRGVNPGIFQPLYSFQAIIMAALGGIATISGSAIGALIYALSTEFLRETQDFNLLIFSIILILIIRFAEHGLLKPALERLKELWDILLGR